MEKILFISEIVPALHFLKNLINHLFALIFLFYFVNFYRIKFYEICAYRDSEQKAQVGISLVRVEGFFLVILIGNEKNRGIGRFYF